MSWLVPRRALTVEQGRAVEMNPKQHRLVLGSPGSGKTIVLVHRARHLIDKYNVPPDRCRLIVYTNALKDYIRAALHDLDISDDCVMTFDAWCGEYYRDHINKRLPWSGRNLDWESIREAVWEKAHLMQPADRLFDFVMVDEGQDLDGRDFETLAGVANHLTVFMDPKQKLYERDADEPGVAKALGLRRRNFVLLGAYRCSPFIVQAGASFIRDDVERREFIAQNPPIEKGERQLPLLYLARDRDDERAYLIQVIRTRVDRNERIAILLPTRWLAFGYARDLQEAGLKVEVNQSTGGKDDSLPPIDFITTSPKIMAFPSSKGLTFDTVLMPCCNKRFLHKIDPDRLDRWLFVGITRATRWIYISTTDGEDTLFLERFRELEQRKQMTIQQGKSRSNAEATPKAKPDQSKEKDDLSDLF